MAYPRTAVEMVEDVLHQAGEVTTTNGPFYTKAWEYLNRCRMDIIRGNGPLAPDAHVAFKWAIAYPHGTFRLEPMYNTGTISVTEGSTTATLSAVPSSSYLGWYLIVDGESDIYRINAIGISNDILTLDTAFTGTTNAAATYKLIKIEYSLSGTAGLLRLIGPLKMYRDHSATKGGAFIDGIGEERFDELFPLRDIDSGIPEAFKTVNYSSNAVTIVTSRYIESGYVKVEYRHIPFPSLITVSSTDAEILIPYEYRFVCTDWAASLIQFDKSDNKFEVTRKKAQAGFDAMVKDHKLTETETDPNYMRVISREDKCQYTTRRLKTSSGLYF